ncbi:hypothetical protein CYMTET_17458, partial [Cymbomonas tetramitiformis]
SRRALTLPGVIQGGKGTTLQGVIQGGKSTTLQISVTPLIPAELGTGSPWPCHFCSKQCSKPCKLCCSMKGNYRVDEPCCIRAMDCRPPCGSCEPCAAGDGFLQCKVATTFIIGTEQNDIYAMGLGGCERVMKGFAQDVYGVAAHPLKPEMIATVCESGSVDVFDAKTRSHSRCTDLGFLGRSVCFSREGSHMAIGGKKGRVRIVASTTLQPLALFKFVDSTIPVMKYSPNNQYLAVGSHDLCIDVYDAGFRSDDGSVQQYPKMNKRWRKELGGTGEYVRVARCEGHSASVRFLDWSLPLANPPHLRGMTILQSNCAGAEILYYDPATGKQIKVNQRNAPWATWTCPLGFGVMGIWETGNGYRSIRSVCRSTIGGPGQPGAEGMEKAGFLVSCDSNSKVKLFNFPCCRDEAPWREYKGHASIVMNVIFGSADRWVFSTGGSDRTMLQWSTHGIVSNETKPASCDVQECEFCSSDQ